MLPLFMVFLIVSAVASDTLNENDAVKTPQTSRFTRTYKEPNAVGVYVEFFDYAPDLSFEAFDNAIESACQTGFWIYYDYANYEGANCWTYGISRCFNTFVSDCSGVVSSLRYAGDPGSINGDYINLYEGDFFVGAEFRTNDTAQSVRNLDKAVSSLIITGNSGWTLFTGLAFSGTALCLAPDEYFADDDGTELNFKRVYKMEDIGLGDNSIRSVIKGCVFDNVEDRK